MFFLNFAVRVVLLAEKKYFTFVGLNKILL